MKYTLLCLLLCVSLAAAADDRSAERYWQVQIGGGYLWGETLYRIGGVVTQIDGTFGGTTQYPLSELRFPLTGPVMTARASMRVSETLQLSLPFRMNIPRYLSGKMRDSDWGIFFLEGYSWAEADSLDIYSESDTRATLLSFMPALRWRLGSWRILSLWCGVGIDLDYFDFSVTNLDQWYPSYSRYQDYLSAAYKDHIRVNKLALTYFLIAAAPNINTRFRLRPTETLDLSVDASFSPLFFVYDQDDHILRKKLSHGYTSGIAVKTAGRAAWQFNPLVGIELNVSWRYAYGDGRQIQTEYADGDSKYEPLSHGIISLHVETLQVQTGGSLRFCF